MIMEESCWNYDVFVSFSGKDVRTGFLDSLYGGLDGTGRCRIYRDDENLERGKEISPNLLKAIKESRISIIAFSTNYAESEWCLDELVEILKCKERNEQLVLPAFYDVDPESVQQITHTFKSAFDQHYTKHSKDRVDRWRAAVTFAGVLSGFDRQNGRETLFIAKIVEHVVAHIKRKPLVVKQPLVASNRVEKVYSLLGIGIKESRMILICGDEGMGKTTIAKLVYNSILSEFNYFCFLENVGRKQKNHPDGILRLQNEILSSMSVRRNVKAQENSEGKSMVMEICMSKKVLVVIDGVDDLKQIEALGAEHYRLFCQGSRIIVTTRYQNLFDKFPAHDQQYPATKLNHKESLELFCWHAFGKAEPADHDEYHYRSNNLAQLAGGVPLALKDLGSYLKGKSKKEWKNTSEKLGEVPPNKLLEFLRKLNAEDDEDDRDKDKDVERSKYEAQSVVSGSWGGEGGEQWAYQPKGEICKISITYDEEAIHSICFTSQGKNGNLERSDQFGGKDGNKSIEIDIDIDIDIEKLNGIRGTVGTYNGLQIITSLCFTTHNNSSYGPFGSDSDSGGAAFSLLGDGDAHTIIGFHGRCSRWLNAIGVKLQPKPKPKPKPNPNPIAKSNRATAGPSHHPVSKLISVGPWGSQELGNKWSYEPKGSISHISISHDDAIRFIQFTSKDENNNEDYSKRFGFRLGSKTDVIRIDINNEKLNNMSGTFDLESGYDVVTSLSFSTDKERIFGPFGTVRGTEFSLMVNDDSLIGFHGRSSDWLDSIGVYLQPRTKLRIGLWGSQHSGNDWSYSPRGAISNMTITHEDVIYTISFTSRDDKGKVHHSGTKGWTTGCNSNEINIDTKYEKFNSISGTIGVKNGGNAITSLSFSTDKNKLFGPYGSATGAAFSLPLKNGLVSGFFGRSGCWLDAIGVYVNHQII